MGIVQLVVVRRAWRPPLLVLGGIVGLAATWLVPSSRSPVMQLSALGMTVVSMLGQ